MSKVLALYHIVFTTKRREPTLPSDIRDDLYRFIWKETTDNGCVLLRIGGMADHIHMLVNLHPSIALSDFMRNIKSKSSSWMATDRRFRSFDSWGRGYFAATISYESRENVIEYIRNQQQHHSFMSADDEFRRLYLSVGMEYYPDDMN